MKDATFILLGATGDLTKRKLIPALYRMVRLEQLESFKIILVARRVLEAKTILENAAKHIGDVDASTWMKIVQSTSYQKLEFHDRHGYEDLRRVLERQELGQEIDQRIFYLATLPDHFDDITSFLKWSKCARSQDKVVYEKPFGDDLQSAKKMNACIRRTFSEKNVYRIDHYLGKELVSNISMLRFTNTFIEPLWCKEYIDQIQIELNEDLGMEGRRGAFYDRYGALKDVVQNHMLQLLALIAMEQPKSLTGEYIRDRKAEVLAKTVFRDALLGQYEKYTKEEGVNESSMTETFAAIKLEVKNKRWKGTPFFLKTGKMLNERLAQIRIIFKRAPCLLVACPKEPNELIIRIQPRPKVKLQMNAKVPGNNFVVNPVQLSFNHSYTFGPNTPDAYTNLLLDVVRGEQGLFVRADEIEHAWAIIDAIKKKKFTPHPYAQGSEGPELLKQFKKKHAMR